MKIRGAWLAVAASLATVLACGGGNNGNNNNGISADDGGFPYTGPSCGAGTINGGCWSCLESSCNGGCLTSACNDFFECFCNCAEGSTSCYQSCESNITSSCEQCVTSIGSCEQSSCSSECGGVSSGSSGGVNPSSSSGGGSGSSSGGGMFVSCGGSGQDCADGASLEFCESGFGGMCTMAYYQVGGQTFPCASCSDTSSCANQAQAACGSIIDAGPPIDAGPVPDAPPPFDGAAATCHSVPCGTMGMSLTYCEMDDGDAGQCTQAWYAVGSQVFECTDCSAAGCQMAEQEASMACP